MGIQKSEAIVLKTHNFRETSLIVNFFTKDFGKIHGLIKGIRNEPQRYGGLPLNFSRNHIVFYEKPQRELNLVTQCDTEDGFTAIRQDLQKTNYALYFIELLDTVTQNFDKNVHLFELTVKALYSLAQDYDCWQIARVFEIKLLNLSGFKPRLDACVHCQKTDIEGGEFSSTLGGIICPNCISKDKDSKKVLPGTIASLEYVEKSSWEKSLNLKLSKKIGQELEEILYSFLEMHLDKRSKVRKFLN
ncbi:MAG: DNA repair protein RecO [Candidatus Omnitrophica bacterium]|nr:DNA repair protein RecO [Candidatus Omnitrophota bacterium]